MVEDILIFSVYEITRHLRQVIETTIEPLYVCGEISNFTHHSSGHMYFNLKDPGATLRCTFFRNVNNRLNFSPEEGMQVVVYGGLTVFEKTGQYNLNVQSMQIQGQGDMARRFELLKQKLFEEGLFDPGHKKVLPRYPQTIGIVTSPTGAALQDIRNIITRRFPVRVLVFPSLVQGAEAPEQLCAGIRYFNQTEKVDVIILTRGGGSQEDLWSFNDENLAREIYASEVPLVSAVGHEIDFSISDLVADLRAPTPSAAAELVVPDKSDLLAILDTYEQRLEIFADNGLSNLKHQLTIAQNKLNSCSPRAILNTYHQTLDHLQDSLEALPMLVKDKRNKFDIAQGMFSALVNYRLSSRISISGLYLSSKETSLQTNLENKLKHHHERLNLAEVFLSESSPKRILSRGYSIMTHKGTVVKSIKDIYPEDEVDLRLSDGSATAVVRGVQGETL